ncbi:FkbM family methyltransferase [Kamptonema cortianum]|nr:FkbM family methyltransferase [Kamptonema cortianum]
MVHVHKGTAACIGNEHVQTTTLDNVVMESGINFDLLKIDVDGFDGEVIAGGGRLIESQKPLVLFEWHPCIWEQVGNNLIQPFEILRSNGYNDLLWFDNEGEFSHFGTTKCIESISKTMHYLKKVNHIRDRHFDILAIPENGLSGYEEIALLTYARGAAKRFPAI